MSFSNFVKPCYRIVQLGLLKHGAKIPIDQSCSINPTSYRYAVRNFSQILGTSEFINNQHEVGKCQKSIDLLKPYNSGGAKYNLLIIRGKKTKKKSAKKYGVEEQFTDDEDSDEEEDSAQWKEQSGLGYKDVKAKVPSLRMDNILKAGIKLSRHKVDTMFYGSKIRVNEKKALKKAQELHEGDEIDVLIGQSDTNPDMIEVDRVVILKIGGYDDMSDKLVVKLRVYKKMLIEKYGNTDDDE